MTGYVLRRLWQSVLVLFAVSLLSFVLIFLSGDPVAALVPLNARAEDMANIRHQYNLDQPILAQYVLFLAKAVTGDLGVVWKHCRQHTLLGVIGSHARRTGAEATLLVHRKTAAIIQDRNLVHIDVHALLVLARQLRPRAQANDGHTHRANDNATSLRALHVDPRHGPGAE